MMPSNPSFQALFANFCSTLTPYEEIHQTLQKYHQALQEYLTIGHIHSEDFPSHISRQISNIDRNPPFLAHILSFYHRFRLICSCEFDTQCEFEEEILGVENEPISRQNPQQERHFYLFSQGENILLSSLLPSGEGIPYEFIITPTMLEQYCNDKEAFSASIPHLDLPSCSTQRDLSVGLSEHIVVRLFKKIKNTLESCK